MFKSFKTFVLLALLSGLILLAGQAIGNRGGLTIALGIADVVRPRVVSAGPSGIRMGLLLELAREGRA